MDTRGQSTKQNKDHPFGHIEWSPPIFSKVSSHTPDEYPKANSDSRSPPGAGGHLTWSTQFHLQQLWHILILALSLKHWHLVLCQHIYTENVKLHYGYKQVSNMFRVTVYVLNIMLMSLKGLAISLKNFLHQVQRLMLALHCYSKCSIVCLLLQ